MNHGTFSTPDRQASRFTFGWKAFAMLAAAFGATPAVAHPGHGGLMVSTESAAHWWVEPEHFFTWVGVGLVLWCAHQARCEWKEAARRKVATQKISKP